MKNILYTLLLTASCLSAFAGSQNLGILTHCPQKNNNELLFAVQANKHPNNQSFVLCSYGTEANTQNILYTNALNAKNQNTGKPAGNWKKYSDVYRECMTNGNTYNCPIVKYIEVTPRMHDTKNI